MIINHIELEPHLLGTLDLAIATLKSDIANDSIKFSLPASKNNTLKDIEVLESLLKDCQNEIRGY